MSHKVYVDKILSQDTDIDAGILWDLEFSPPRQLHSDIMSKIHSEGKIRRRFNYKLFVSTAAAVVALAVFINGSRSVFNGFQVAENIPNTNVKDTLQITPTPTAAGVLVPGINVMKEPDLQEASKTNTVPESIAENSNTTTAVKPGKVEATPTIVAEKTQTADSNKLPADTVKNEDGTAKSIDLDKSVAMGIGDKGITDGQKSESGAQLSDKDANINLEIVLPDSKNEVFQFVKTNGVLIDDGEYKIYKLDPSKTEELSNIVTSNDYEMKVVNGQLNGNDMVVRLVVKQ